MEANFSKLRLNYGSIYDPRLILKELNNKPLILFCSEELNYLHV